MNLDVNLRSSSGGNGPIVPVFGYEGNGIAEVLDATITPNLLGVSEEILANDPISIDLDIEYIQELLKSDSFLGMLAVGSEGVFQAGFNNITNTPTLTLNYDLLSPGDFDLDKEVDGADFMKWLRGDSFQPGSPSDLEDWRENFGTALETATIASVPEPCGCVHLFTVGLLLLLGRSCGKCNKPLRTSALLV